MRAHLSATRTTALNRASCGRGAHTCAIVCFECRMRAWCERVRTPARAQRALHCACASECSYARAYVHPLACPGLMRAQCAHVRGVDPRLLNASRGLVVRERAHASVRASRTFTLVLRTSHAGVGTVQVHMRSRTTCLHGFACVLLAPRAFTSAARGLYGRGSARAHWCATRATA